MSIEKDLSFYEVFLYQTCLLGVIAILYNKSIVMVKERVSENQKSGFLFFLDFFGNSYHI